MEGTSFKDQVYSAFISKPGTVRETNNDGFVVDKAAADGSWGLGPASRVAIAAGVIGITSGFARYFNLQLASLSLPKTISNLGFAKALANSTILSALTESTLTIGVSSGLAAAAVVNFGLVPLVENKKAAEGAPEVFVVNNNNLKKQLELDGQHELSFTFEHRRNATEGSTFEALMGLLKGRYEEHKRKPVASFGDVSQLEWPNAAGGSRVLVSSLKDAADILDGIGAGGQTAANIVQHLNNVFDHEADLRGEAHVALDFNKLDDAGLTQVIKGAKNWNALKTGIQELLKPGQ